MYVRGNVKQLSPSRRLLPVEGTTVNLSELKLSLNNLRWRKSGKFSLLLLHSVIPLSSRRWITPTLFAETSGKRKRVMSLARFFDSLQLSRPTMLYSERPSINFPPFPYLFRSFFTHGGGVGAAMRISGSTSVPLLCCVVFCTFSTLRASFLFCCYSNGQHEI